MDCPGPGQTGADCAVQAAVAAAAAAAAVAAAAAAAAAGADADVASLPMQALIAGRLFPTALSHGLSQRFV